MITRRRFLIGVATVGARLRPTRSDAEPPPEVATLRIGMASSVCLAPQAVAEDLLRAEGFTDVRYVEIAPGLPGAKSMSGGDVDVGMNFAAPLIIALDGGAAISVLSGVHVGCFQLIATDAVRTVKDLKGRSVSILGVGSGQHVFLSTILTQVGLDPRKDVTWVTKPPPEAKQLLAEGKIDGYLGFPPDPQELREKKIGHVVLNSATDRPWSQYFCCMFSANRDFAARHPVATKRALRAVLKGDQLCALEPSRAADAVMRRGISSRKDHTEQAIREIPYGRWREYDPADTLRFYALRLHEAGMIKASPQKILAQGTDWRFVNELKKELKG